MAAESLYISTMCRSRIEDNFITRLQGFRPDRYGTTRALSLYSASMALADTDCLRAAQNTCRELGATSRQLYEIMLQSYLFLGFPRMLTAAEILAADNHGLEVGGAETAEIRTGPDEWRKRGRELCRRVYQGNYDALKARVEAMAPEVFSWMELEGYGKVLSRPGLDIIDREMAIVACLLMENRPAQLHSHLRGALNVGAPRELVQDVLSDVGPIAPESYTDARVVIESSGTRAAPRGSRMLWSLPTATSTLLRKAGLLSWVVRAPMRANLKRAKFL